MQEKKKEKKGEVSPSNFASAFFLLLLDFCVSSHHNERPNHHHNGCYQAVSVCDIIYPYDSCRIALVCVMKNRWKQWNRYQNAEHWEQRRGPYAFHCNQHHWDGVINGREHHRLYFNQLVNATIMTESGPRSESPSCWAEIGMWCVSHGGWLLVL